MDRNTYFRTQAMDDAFSNATRIYIDALFQHSENAYNATQKFLMSKVKDGSITMLDRAIVMHEVLLSVQEAVEEEEAEA